MLHAQILTYQSRIFDSTLFNLFLLESQIYLHDVYNHTITVPVQLKIEDFEMNFNYIILYKYIYKYFARAKLKVLKKVVGGKK